MGKVEGGALAALVALLCWADLASAAFPGPEGPLLTGLVRNGFDVLEADGTLVRRVPISTEGEVSASADGTRVVVSGETEFRFAPAARAGLAVVGIDGTGARTITRGSFDESRDIYFAHHSPRWTPDGRIVFLHDRPEPAGPTRGSGRSTCAPACGGRS